MSVERLREILRESPTPEIMKVAGEAFKQVESQMKRKGKGSSPILCSLGYKKPYPSAIPLKNLGDQIASNKAVFELVGKILNRGD